MDFTINGWNTNLKQHKKPKVHNVWHLSSPARRWKPLGDARSSGAPAWPWPSAEWRRHVAWWPCAALRPAAASHSLSGTPAHSSDFGLGQPQWWFLLTPDIWCLVNWQGHFRVKQKLPPLVKFWFSVDDTHYFVSRGLGTNEVGWARKAEIKDRIFGRRWSILCY